jgi:hypothetical protein
LFKGWLRRAVGIVAIGVAVVGLQGYVCAEEVKKPGPAAPSSAVDAEAVLARAAGWLWDRQGEDGGWHSETYGLLKSGQAYTPFVLAALLDVPADVVPRPPAGVERGLQFIRRHVSERGALGWSDPDVLEYPNYATADALRCLLRAADEGDRLLIVRLREYLESQQYGEARGFEPGHPAYGGWGFGGALPPGVPGHMDLAHTRRVLEALRAAGTNRAEPYRSAAVFLRLVQKHPDDPREQPSLTPFSRREIIPVPYDGGFYFSPVVLQANKGGEAVQGRPYFRSYASATCDGILALLAAGVAADDERIRSAAAWLARHPRLDYPEGIPEDGPEPWGPALRFYHIATRADVYRRLDWPGAWRAEAARLLAGWQDEDGSFRNSDSPLMKEDDWLLATTLAVSALNGCRAR